MASSVIIEHLQITHPGPARFIRDNRSSALEVRMLDRIFDNRVMAQMQRVVNDALRRPERRDEVEVEQAKVALEKTYDWLDRWLERREWAAADELKQHHWARHAPIGGAEGRRRTTPSEIGLVEGKPPGRLLADMKAKQSTTRRSARQADLGRQAHA